MANGNGKNSNGNGALKNGNGHPLTSKQKVFIAEYLNTWNAAEAARRAGYAPKTASVIGAENFLKPILRAEIDKRLKMKQMGAEEVLARLASHARGDLRSFIDAHGEVDLSTEEAKAHLYLIRKIKTRSWWEGRDQNRHLVVEKEIELHDPQAALVHVGRHWKLFTDKFEGELIVKDWRDAAAQMGVDPGEVMAEFEKIAQEGGGDSL